MGEVAMYKRDLSGWTKHADFIALDLVSLQLACMLAYILRFWPGRGDSCFLYADKLYANLALLLAGIDFVVCIVAPPSCS